MHRMVLAVVIGLCISLVHGELWAGPAFQDPRNTCTTTNCRSQRLRGFYQPRQSFVIHAFAAAGDCVRFEVTRQTTDLEMAVVSTDVEENHWVDDDSGVGLMPLIEIDPAPVTGWYVVIVSDFLGRDFNANFDLRYGRYNSGNPNCANPTPLSIPADESVPDELKLIEE